MTLDDAKKILRKWACKNKVVLKVYMYGSRVKGDFKNNSDLDVAIYVDQMQGDTNAFTTFICEKSNWVQELESLLGCKVDLKWYNKNDKSSITRTSVETSGVLVYSRDKGIKSKERKQRSV